MKNLIYKIVFVMASMLVLTRAYAQQFYEQHVNARAMALGNAYTSLVSDDESLFYNPAGLAKNGGVYWTIVDGRAGLSDPSALKDLADLQDETKFREAVNDLYGEPIWAQLGGKSTLLLPFFAAGYFYDVDASVTIDNPVSPILDVSYVKDSGIAAGFGLPMGPFLQSGFVFKKINRTGARKKWGPSVVSDIITGTTDPSTLADQLENKGTGLSADFGFNITIPGPIKPTISFVWKNIGNTKFTALNEGDTPPPTDEQEWIVGTSLMVNLGLVHVAPTLDVKHLNDQDNQITKKVHMGLELGLPLVDLRVGLHQGYMPYGAGINLGPIHVDAASWGTEVGGYPGQLESRRYMVQATIRLGLDLGIGQGGDGSKGSGSGSGSKGSSSRKIKHRR